MLWLFCKMSNYHDDYIQGLYNVNNRMNKDYLKKNIMKKKIEKFMKKKKKKK